MEPYMEVSIGNMWKQLSLYNSKAEDADLDA